MVFAEKYIIRTLVLLALGVLLFFHYPPLHGAPTRSTVEASAIQTPAVAVPEIPAAMPGEAGAEGHKTQSAHQSPKSHHIFNIHLIPVTNSMISSWIVALLMVFASLLFSHSLKTGKLKSFTGLVEFAVSFLLDFFKDLIGNDLVRRTFWFLASLFFFILLINWADLIPGVGSIGWGMQTPDGFEITRPLFRGAAADLNLTFALSGLFFIYWFFLAIKMNGPIGFILHIFGPKGESRGVMYVVMVVVFIAVGFLEIISILVRPLSLSLRLYGNIFAGGVLLETMMRKFPAFAWIVPLPFYFMETLVGVVQAFVFALLSAVFIMLMCSHDGEHEPSSGVEEKHAG